MTQNLFTLFPRALFYKLSRCIVVVVFILEQQRNDGNEEFKRAKNPIYTDLTQLKFLGVKIVVHLPEFQ